MRNALLALVPVLLSACGDATPAVPPTAPTTEAPTEPATSPAGSPPTTTDPSAVAVPGEPTTPATSARRAAPSTETLADVARIVREARALEHGGDHRAALSRFNDALRLVPSQPRVLCEAGFIAHRAGDTALAAQRIDTALAVFGPERTISDRLRVPLAMCLYNRGIVAEAEADPRVAVSSFEASLRLRPNATVETALTRARAAVAALPPGAVRGAPSIAAAPSHDDEPSHVGGVVLGEHYRLLAADVDAYERALRAGLRGMDEWSETYAAPDTTSVRRWAFLEGAEHPTVAVHTVRSDGQPLIANRLVIGWRSTEGYQSFDLDLGSMDSGDGGDETNVTVDSVTASWVDAMLRVDASYTVATSSQLFYTGDGPEGDVSCQDGMEESVTTDITVLCRDEGEYRACEALTTAVESTGSRSWSWCGDDGGGSEERTPAVHSRAILAVTPEGIRISQLRDEESLLNVLEGASDWDAVFSGLGVELPPTEWVTDEEAEGE